ncbi:MAG TPA: vitamin B12-dependent ribonucleotide reductase, partial [Acidimicrobiales bacterium]|nr:vitamin B12-dependent ribonucleotide reductase [Acidimicrobiales bacterium]
MELRTNRGVLGFRRYFTQQGESPYETIEWERRDARLIDHRDGSVAFEQTDIEVPVTWSMNATNILAQKYFRGTLDTPEREFSLKQVADRVTNTITAWGVDQGYFEDDDEAEAFSDELKFLIIHQRAAFNSPVWFNIGVDGVPQQASACFILSVEDEMSSILNWYVEEGTIFKGGSGSGVNLSRIRSSLEKLKGGGDASGPVSFMRGADASAGTIKSGGKTRRAAKMVILDADHPDIEEFIWCKALEEKKMKALENAGFDMSLNGADIHSVQFQNANNSVRITDEFMEAVDTDGEWNLTARTDGSVMRTVKARDLFQQMSQAAWECADPGLQFDTTINHWHTASNTGPITASNPCSEYVHLDNSACNLASLNLLTFLDSNNESGIDAFDIEGFCHAIEIIFTAQDILVSNADYPTEAIGETTRAFRQLGMGYANLGALLMALGLPYDSDEGREISAALTSLMTGHAYRTSTRLADRLGPFEGFETNREPMLKVLDQHREAAELLDTSAATKVGEAGSEAWFEACALAQRVGVRNSQATVLAPTGTIGLLMDCDTTGIEPDFSLVKMKRLVGGGTMSIVNQTIPRALKNFGHSSEETEAIVEYINENQTVIGSPGLDESQYPVFATSMGDNSIHHLGHVRMMGAVQPFLSGAISKTCNMPEDVSVDDVEELYMESWKLGLKAVAIYRDNCKLGQPLSTGKNDSKSTTPLETVEKVGASLGEPVRRKLPRSRASRTFEFRVADCKGWATVGEFEDGTPGEVFLRVSKQGSTMAGIMDAFAISLSHGLQYGVPLRAYVEAFTGMRFEPAGMT